MRNFGNIEGHACIYFRWLNPRLLQFPGDRQPILRDLRAQFKSRRLHFWPLFIS